MKAALSLGSSPFQEAGALRLVLLQPMDWAEMTKHGPCPEGTPMDRLEVRTESWGIEVRRGQEGFLERVAVGLTQLLRESKPHRPG